MTTPLAFEPIETDANAMLHAHYVPVVTSRPVEQQMQQFNAGIALDPFVIDKGQPQADTGYGAASSSTAYIDAGAITAITGYPAAAAANTGADYKFIPAAVYLSGGVWFPVGGSAAAYPQLQVVSRPTYPVEPYFDANYAYVHRGKRITHPAFDLDGNGSFKLVTASGGVANYTRATLMMVLVPHAGRGSSWAIYDAGTVNNASGTFSLRYKKGVIELYSKNGRLLSHQCLFEHSEPIIVIVAFDSNNHQGRFMCVDRRRSSRSFSSVGLSGVDFNGIVGGQYTTPTSGVIDYTKASDMDLLEMDLWLGTALTFHQMEGVAALMSAVYSVGP